jgi:hypothetical protein
MKWSFDAMSVPTNINLIPNYLKSNDKKQINVLFFAVSFSIPS